MPLNGHTGWQVVCFESVCVCVCVGGGGDKSQFEKNIFQKEYHFYQSMELLFIIWKVLNSTYFPNSD